VKFILHGINDLLCDERLIYCSQRNCNEVNCKEVMLSGFQDHGADATSCSHVYCSCQYCIMNSYAKLTNSTAKAMKSIAKPNGLNSNYSTSNGTESITKNFKYQIPIYVDNFLAFKHMVVTCMCTHTHYFFNVNISLRNIHCQQLCSQ